MEHTEEILEIVREIREDVSYMKRHRNMLCGMPVLEVDEVCDLLKMSDRQLRRYRTSGQLVGFRFGRRLLFSSAEITRFIERIEADCQQKNVEKSCPQSLIYIVMSDNTTERTYCLVESGIFERLLKTYFMQAQSLLLFEHLLGHSDRPMFLSARKVCEVLGLDRNKLEQYRRKRIIKARAVNGQMMYSAYDLIALTEHLQRRKIQRILSATARFIIR